MSPLVEVHHSPPVVTLVLNRPERHNSLVPELLDELLAAVRTVGSDDSIRAVVLAAAGRSFSTGGDVRAFYEAADLEEYASDIVGRLNELIVTMVAFDRPIIAAVHGMVTGGSIGLLLGSDVVLMAAEASITPWYSVVGYAPDGGWTALLPGVIGRRRTAAILLSNATMTAQDAVAWGLAAAVHPSDEVVDRATALARDIAAMKPGSVARTKRLLNIDDIAAGLERERQTFVKQILTPEARLGMEAFLGEG